MAQAVFTTGGKQYVAQSGKKMKVEKLPQEEGSDVVFDQVLLVEDGGKTEIGKPFVQGASVKAKVLRQAKGKKVIIFKFKSKKRQKTKKGHRQFFTEVEITGIENT
jgi:large subunit ribosomal protein L21